MTGILSESGEERSILKGNRTTVCRTIEGHYFHSAGNGYIFAQAGAGEDLSFSQSSLGSGRNNAYTPTAPSPPTPASMPIRRRGTGAKEDPKD
jgi:hypothetical protein